MAAPISDAFFRAISISLFTLTAGLTPLAALAQTLPAGCAMNELAMVPLIFTTNGVPLVEATLNGSKIPALLDLGQQHATAISKKTLDQLGVPIRSTETNYPGVFVMNSLIDHFALGPNEHKKSWFPVEDIPYDFIGAKIGANYLLRTDLELNFEDRYIKYFKPTGCYRAKLAYWDANAVSVPARHDSRRRDLRPWFKVRINGKDISATLSTADEHTYMDLFTAQRMGLSTEAPGAVREEPVVGWYDRSQSVWTVPVAEMMVGDLKVTDFKVRLMNMDLTGEAIFLGADFLRRHRVYIAMSQNRIYFTPITSAPVPPQPAPTSSAGTTTAALH